MKTKYKLLDSKIKNSLYVVVNEMLPQAIDACVESVYECGSFDADEIARVYSKDAEIFIFDELLKRVESNVKNYEVETEIELNDY